MTDNWQRSNDPAYGTISTPATGHELAVTNTDFSQITRAIYVGTSGNYTLVLRDDATNDGLLYTGMVAGTVYPLRVRRVVSAAGGGAVGTVMGLW